jgi:hypothetical protein
MARARRPVNVFGLSFLDVMFCGFGSIILLVMIINATAITHRKEVTRDLRGEVERVQREVFEGERYLAELHASLEATGRASAEAEGAVQGTREAIGAGRAELASVLEATRARTDRLDALQAELKALEASRDAAAAEVAAREAELAARGRKVRRFVGESDRQYLTGLKMGGSRVLILIDASASMLAETVVNVILRRNLSEAERRRSPKWRRALATVEWLVSQLPSATRYQIVAFNTDAWPVLEGTRGRWLDAGDAKQLDLAIAALRDIVPRDGTSLHQAFTGMVGLQPAPDNIFLLTDGLPTQGSGPPLGSKVTGQQRLRHFQRSLGRLPPGVPVNVILFPMEGDPLAASAFWKLAMATRGSFLSPSRDWP